MVQLPAPVRWTVEPVTLQLPLAPKVKVKPEVALPLTPKSGSPKFFATSAPNVIVWLALAIGNVCGTSGAALQLVSPACEAVIVQEPAPVRWTVVPVTLQLPLAPKLTVRAEDAFALTVKSGSPKVLPPKAPNVMVWLPLAIENDCGTSVAAL